jgi:hypothetical protein
LKKKQVPPLIKLEYGDVFCELCKRSIPTGGLVAWWQVVRRGGRRTWTAYCSTCHHTNIRHGHPLR